MTGKEMVTRSAGSLALDPAQTGWTEVQRAALVQLGLDDAPDADLAVFLHFAQRTGLDPFARQLYMIARWDSQARRNKYTIQAAIDGLRIVAERHGQYGGQVGPQWCGPDGVWSDVWLKKGPPVAARVGVIRKDWSQVMYATAHFGEYSVTKSGGALTSMWQGKGALMIAKCAEALALRKAFPQDLAGVYTEEEMAQADAVQAEAERQSAPEPPRREQPEAIDWDAALAEAAGDVAALQKLYNMARGVEPNNAALAERIAAAGKAAAQAAEASAEPVDADVVEDAPEPRATEKQLTAIAAALGEHGVKDREDRLAVVSFLVGAPIGTTKNLARSEAAHVLDTVARFAEAARWPTRCGTRARHGLRG